MPSGREHAEIWKTHRFTAALLTALSAFAVIAFRERITNSWWWILPFGVAFGYLVAYFIDPDLDTGGATSAEWRLYNKFSILGIFIITWFTPYGYIMRHRSFWSHFPFVGTAIRLVWLLMFPPFALILWNTTEYLVPTYYPLLIGLFIGLSFGDLLHYLADIGWSLR